MERGLLEHVIFAVKRGIKKKTVGRRTEVVPEATDLTRGYSKESVTIGERLGIKKLTVGKSSKNFKNQKKLMRSANCSVVV